MPNYPSLITAIALSFSCTSANAELLKFYRSHHDDVWSVFLKGGALNGNFNALSFEAVPTGGSAFSHVQTGLAVSVLRPPGQKFTYRSRFLDFDPLDPDNPGVGKGWTILGPVQTSTKIYFAGGPLGQKISTANEPRGELFLANFYMPDWPNGSLEARLVLVNGADTVATELSIPSLTNPRLPEPHSICLLLLGGVGLFNIRRGAYSS